MTSFAAACSISGPIQSLIALWLYISYPLTQILSSFLLHRVRPIMTAIALTESQRKMAEIVFNSLKTKFAIDNEEQGFAILVGCLQNAGFLQEPSPVPSTSEKPRSKPLTGKSAGWQLYLKNQEPLHGEAYGDKLKRCGEVWKKLPKEEQDKWIKMAENSVPAGCPPVGTNVPSGLVSPAKTETVIKHEEPEPVGPAPQEMEIVPSS